MLFHETETSIVSSLNVIEILENVIFAVSLKNLYLQEVLERQDMLLDTQV